MGISKTVQLTEIIQEIWTNQNDFLIAGILSGADVAISFANDYVKWCYTYTALQRIGAEPATEYSKYEWFKVLWDNYVDNNLANFALLYNALHTEYDPVNTIDYKESENMVFSHENSYGKSRTTTFNNLKSQTDYNSNVTDQVTTDTDITLRDDTKQNRGGHDSTTQSGSFTVADSGVDTLTDTKLDTQNYKTYTGRRDVDIASRLMTELKLRTDADLSDYIISGFADRHLYLINDIDRWCR